jgi:hypothetical protein
MTEDRGLRTDDRLQSNEDREEVAAGSEQIPANIGPMADDGGQGRDDR